MGIFKEPFYIGRVIYARSYFEDPRAIGSLAGGIAAGLIIVSIVVSVLIKRKKTGMK